MDKKLHRGGNEKCNVADNEKCDSVGMRWPRERNEMDKKSHLAGNEKSNRIGMEWPCARNEMVQGRD